MRLVAIVAVVVVALGMQACYARTDEGRRERAWDKWDLTSPPTRSEVGLTDGESTVIYQDSPSDSQTIIVRLPEGAVLQVQANLVSFSAIGTRAPLTADPTVMDIWAGPLELDDARAEFVRAVITLDQATAPVDDWYRNALAADGADRVESTWVRGRFGYLTVEAQGRYSALNETARVAYVLTWR